jgi:ketosteroid isomerase-like protein
MKGARAMPAWRRWLFGAALVSFLLGQACAQTKDIAAILVKENEWNETFKTSDHAAMRALLAEDYLITEEDGKIYDKEGYIALVSDETLHVEVSEFAELKVRVYGRTAIVTGLYHAKGVQKGAGFELRDRFTDIWQKNGKAWSLVGSHYSLLPASPEASGTLH